MADLGAIAIILVVLCSITWMAIKLYNKRFALDKACWEVKDFPAPEGIYVRLEYPGQHPQIVGGPLKTSDPNFDNRLEELHAEADFHLSFLKSHELHR